MRQFEAFVKMILSYKYKPKKAKKPRKEAEKKVKKTKQKPAISKN